MAYKGLALKYNVENSFNSLLGVEICGRLLFENIIDMDGIIRLPKNINKELFISLIETVSVLHEEHEIELNKSEVVLFYISITITSIFFENKSFDDAKKILPMLDTRTINEYFHLQKSYLKYSKEMLRFINDNFAKEPQFREALKLLCNWKLNRTPIVNNYYNAGN